MPTNPNNFTSRWADFFVSLAGPGMNLLLAFVAINAYSIGVQMGLDCLLTPGPSTFFVYLAVINLVLMLFNLIPLGALDGHYILPYFLSRRAAAVYRDINDRYGNFALMALVLLSFAGVPIFRLIFSVARTMLPYLPVF